MEPQVGIGPTTARLQIGCSTTELPRQLVEVVGIEPTSEDVFVAGTTCVFWIGSYRPPQGPRWPRCRTIPLGLGPAARTATGPSFVMTDAGTPTKPRGCPSQLLGREGESDLSLAAGERDQLAVFGIYVYHSFYEVCGAPRHAPTSSTSPSNPGTPVNHWTPTLGKFRDPVSIERYSASV